MKIIRIYFREHRWQKRVVLALLSLIAGGVAGLWLVPIYRNWQLVQALGSSERTQRLAAVDRATKQAYQDAAFRRQLEEALDTDSDERFQAIATVLRRLRKFDTPGREPIWLDRWRCLQIEQNQSPAPPDNGAKELKRWRISAWAKRSYMFELVVSDRDNRYIRRACLAAAADPAPRVRETAATLAAKLGEDATLRKLMADPDGWVAALAALDAGLARRGELTGDINTLLEKSIAQHRAALREFRKIKTPTQADRETLAAKVELVACCAYALAELRAERAFAKVRTLAKLTDDAELQQRLLVAMVKINAAADAQAVVEIIRQASQVNSYPPAMAMQAAAEMKLADPAVVASAEKILQDAAKGQAGLESGQVIAALRVAEVLNLRQCSEAVAEICEKFWSPGRGELLTPAAGLLGKFAEQLPRANPQRKKYLQLLRDASQYAALAAQNKSNSQPGVQTTPLASAAAAVACWLVEPTNGEFLVSRKEARPGDASSGLVEAEVRKTSMFYLRQALAVDQALPGDYAVWNIALAKPSQAFALGEVFLPANKPGQKGREYNPQVRCAGAGLLAISARSSEQKTLARERISRRLTRLDFFERGARLCAMLMLGQREYLQDVRELLAMDEFPARRVMTALLVAGDKSALDRTLWNVNFPLARLRELLVAQCTNQVFARTAPLLPKPSASASVDTQLWQMRLMRQAYSIGRAKMPLGLKRN